MMKRISYVLKRGVSSRVGHFLLILHLSLVVWIFGQETPVPRAQNNARQSSEHYSSSQLLAGRGFHWHYESAQLKLLILVDLPGILLSFLIALISVPLFYFLPPLGAYDNSWCVALIFLAGASIQWQFTGYWMEQLIRERKNTQGYTLSGISKGSQS